MRPDGFEQAVEHDNAVRHRLQRAEIERLVVEVARDPREEKSDVGCGVWVV